MELLESKIQRRDLEHVTSDLWRSLAQFFVDDLRCKSNNQNIDSQDLRRAQTQIFRILKGTTVSKMRENFV